MVIHQLELLLLGVHLSFKGCHNIHPQYKFIIWAVYNAGLDQVSSLREKALSKCKLRFYDSHWALLAVNPYHLEATIFNILLVRLNNPGKISERGTH